MFTFKKWLKKFCLFSASASLAFYFCSPLANAKTPGTDDKGIKVEGSVSISKNQTELKPTATIELKSDLVYNGSFQNIIDRIVNVKLGETSISDYTSDWGVKLYLRVANDDEQHIPADGDWIRYTGDDSLSNIKLQRSDAGIYYVYYYIDGNGNCNDSGSDNP